MGGSSTSPAARSRWSSRGPWPPSPLAAAGLLGEAQERLLDGVQARLVALALGQLNVQGAVVVGHSMGFDVAIALATQSSELADRVVDIDEAPDPSFGGLPFLAKLTLRPRDRTSAAPDLA